MTSRGAPASVAARANAIRRRAMDGTRRRVALKAWALAVVLASLHVYTPPGASAVLPKPCAPGCVLHGGTCNQELGRCDCPRHLDDVDGACRPIADARQLKAKCADLGWSTKQCANPRPHGKDARCLSACHGNGTCVGGFCQCAPGYYGADCALRTGPDGRPAILPERGYAPRSRGPRIYVYELPPRLSVWRADVLMTERHTLDLFRERLIPTGARVADGDEADWFFIPVTLRNRHGQQLLVDTIDYVRQAHPWWNATGGHRHFVIATGDYGRAESEYPSVREAGRLSANVTFVTYWGLHSDRPNSTWVASHRNATDIVLPVHLSAPKMAATGSLSSRLHPKFTTLADPEVRDRDGPLFYFTGRICGDGSVPRKNARWPHCRTSLNRGYSGGIRQLVHYFHGSRKGFQITPRDPEYAEHMTNSRFCFGPPGGGHGQRQIQAVLAGCVPVIIADGVLQAFEPILDWSEFGVRVAEADIPRLHKILAAIGPEEYERKASRLRCAAQHMAFSLSEGASMGESGRFDAFETLLEILRAKAAHPDVPFERLRRVDAQLDAFMDCRGPESDEEAAEEEEGGERGLSSNAKKLRGVTAGWASTAVRLMREAGVLQGSAVSGRRGPLCSISPFDAGDPGVVACPREKASVARVVGGQMCASSPLDAAACSRPWR